MSSRCARAIGFCCALALFGDAKQAMGEEKSGPVETRLTGPVATALIVYPEVLIYMTGSGYQSY